MFTDMSYAREERMQLCRTSLWELWFNLEDTWLILCEQGVLFRQEKYEDTVDIKNRC